MGTEYTYTCKSLNKETWNDFVELFGKHGASGGCWCMFFRESSQEYKENSGEKNKELMRDLVQHDQQIGLLAYDGNRAVGWCAFAPRKDSKRIEKILEGKTIDNVSAWAITCFFTAKDHRHKGVTQYLIKQAIEFAKGKGISIIEAYPSIPKESKIPDDDGYTGFYDVFIKLGFVEVSRVRPNAPVLRFVIR